MKDLNEQADVLAKKAGLKVEDGAISMQDYDKSATADNDTGALTDVVITSLDAEGNELQVGDIVDCVNNEERNDGIVKDIQDKILVEWPDETETEEEAVNLVLSQVDDSEEDEEEDDTDEDDKDIDDDNGLEDDSDKQ
jgi:hypothetical protein